MQYNPIASPFTTMFLLSFSLLLSLLVRSPLVSCHPQCLDFRPPFRPVTPLRFCYHHTDTGCCTSTMDMTIYDEYLELLYSHPNRTLAGQCVGLLFHVKCSECNPYAAHVFDAEDTGVRAPFPGLCPDFCRLFMSLCRDFVPRMTNDSNLIRMASDPGRTNDFCTAVAIRDTAYCYPTVLRNPDLMTELGNTFASDEDCICLQEVERDLRNPLLMEVIPDGSGRIVIGEQAGVLYVYSHDWVKTQTPFMDVAERVVLSGSPGDERGFLAVTFHPNFRRNGKLYCYFSARTTTGERGFSTQLYEYKIDSSNPNRVDLDSERLLIELKQPYSNHNGGTLFFGQDGMLYLFTGDGGAGGDPRNLTQNLLTMFGKALRIDVDSPPDTANRKPYAIPRDNPFIGRSGILPEIWAYGLRNPWRCSQDPGDISGAGRGRIFCGDVGQNAWEEISIIESGKDYGWRRREGFECYISSECGSPLAEEVLPIFAYNRTVGRSVTGGYVYRGCENPALNGAYIFGDYVSGRLIKLEEDARSSSQWSSTILNTCGSDLCFNGLTNQYASNILSFGTDENGELYILSAHGAASSRPNGRIYKIVDPRRRGDPSQCRIARTTG